jgi:hypothetical protein
MLRIEYANKSQSRSTQLLSHDNNKYGALILVIAFLVARRVMKSGLVIIAFIPYMVHIFYHNDGPYQSDFLIWFLIPLFNRIDAVKWSRPVARRRATLVRGSPARLEGTFNE